MQFHALERQRTSAESSRHFLVRLSLLHFESAEEKKNIFIQNTGKLVRIQILLKSYFLQSI